MNPEMLKQYEPQPTDVKLDYERQLWQARYAPCGGWLIACGYDASIQRWHDTGSELQPMDSLKGHNGWVQCFDFVGTDERLLTADSWGKLACWKYSESSPQPIWSLAEAHDGWIRALAVSPDGALVASGGNDEVIRIWSTADGKLQHEWPHPERIFSLCFDPSGSSLVSGGLRGVVRQWEMPTGKTMRELNASVLYQLHRIQECGGARHLAFDRAGQRLAVAGQKSPEGAFATGLPCVLVFDWQSGELVREMAVGTKDDGFAYDARFHPDGFVMAVSCAFPGKGHLWFWKPDEDQAFLTSNKIPNGRSLSLHPDGRRLALLTSLSANGNGRPLKGGVYAGGTARIHVLRLGSS